ncbi:MAG: M28 family peptidase [Saprospiraceae bacterium]|nr:M28 family peptidase [Saprospiraceae bacterium]MBK8669537.1 M28 family peptidase [Saprospiraceae bacterium]
MNVKNIVVVIFCLLSIGTIQAQYESGVTTPDKTKPKVVDKLLPEVRYAESVHAATLRKHLRVLASDSLEGRETGKKGLEMAGDYIVKIISNQGLLPAVDTSYYQDVAFTYSGWGDTDIFVNKERFRHLWDYLAFPDKNANVPAILEKEVIFLGYGIDDPKYSDYKKVNVKDKIIMINRGEPVNKDSVSFITKTKNMSEWSNDDMEKKLAIAKAKGVKLVLIIEKDIKKMLDVNRKKLMGSYLELGDMTSKEQVLANHAYISSTIAKAVIGSNETKIISARKKLEKGKPASLVMKTDIIMNMTKDVKVVKGKNIIGYIKGKSKPDEFVVVSAHYDHLGKRGDEIFNGADDNGSGTSTLLELSQSVQQAVLESNRPERSIVFIWFCGEEKGLLGSKYYSENPIFPLEKTVVDINVDMVGRSDEKYKDNPDYIYVIGSDRLSTDLHKVNEDVNQKYTQLTLDYTYNNEDDPNQFYYRSDHYNFARLGIPSIFYFSGTHEDYHRTSDDVDKINFDKMANVGKLIFHTMWEIANRKDGIVPDKVKK